MQFRDLNAQYKALKKEIDHSIQTVLDSGRFILGPQVAELEERLAAYVGVKHCITCANGTDALILVLMAWGIKGGDAVFVPDFTYIASASCAAVRGAAPVFVDIDSRTFNMSPAALESAIQKTIKAGRLMPKVIIPVDLFGQPAEHEAIAQIAKQHGLKVLEDAAQGFGGAIDGKKAGSFGDAAITSFFPAKPLGCYGDGGAIFTDDDELNVTLRALRANGSTPQDKYDNRYIGINSRLDTLQAAILLPKLKAFTNHELDAANRVAEQYTQALKDNVVTPYIKPGYRSAWAQYTILLKDNSQRDGLQQHLKEQGIPSMIYYPRGMHQQSAFKEVVNACDYAPDEFRNTEDVCQRCLALPVYGYMGVDEVSKVADAVKEYVG